MSTEKVLVVDDDKSIVKILKGYLEQAGFQVVTAYQGDVALHLLRRENPDVLLLDLMLPDKDGWDLTRIIRNDPSLSRIPIIMITARIEDTDKIIGLELGADDYITKPFNTREVVARIRAILRRRQLDSQPAPTVLRVGDLELDMARHQLYCKGAEIDLTPTEYKLIEKFMTNPGHTFTREELLETALGYGYEGFGRTLDTHMGNLRKKIEDNPKEPVYIQTIYSIGYRLNA